MQKMFVFRISRGVYSIPLAEIIFMEKQKRKVLLHTREEKHLFYATFDQIAEQLDERFCRCHRSYIINMDHVKTMNGGRILLSEGTVLVLGGRAYSRSLHAFEAYLRRRLNR